MSEKGLRHFFIISTVLFLIILGAMAVDTLAQVRNQNTPPLTAEVIAGKDLWQAQNCNDCHTILGIGGYFAPDLTQVVVRRDAAWLNSFLLNPQQAKPGTTMPNQLLTAIQANQLMSFFQWVSQVNTNGWPPQPRLILGGTSPNAALDPNATPDPVVEGQQIYSRKGCNGCHMINGMGAISPGPDLSKIGSQPYDALPNDPEFLTKWLQNPLEQKPTTTMPRIALTDAEINALVAYLTSLK